MPYSASSCRKVSARPEEISDLSQHPETVQGRWTLPLNACFPGLYVEYPIRPKKERTEPTNMIFPGCLARAIRSAATCGHARQRGGRIVKGADASPSVFELQVVRTDGTSGDAWAGEGEGSGSVVCEARMMIKVKWAGTPDNWIAVQAWWEDVP